MNLELSNFSWLKARDDARASSDDCAVLGPFAAPSEEVTRVWKTPRQLVAAAAPPARAVTPVDRAQARETATARPVDAPGGRENARRRRQQRLNGFVTAVVGLAAGFAIATLVAEVVRVERTADSRPPAAALAPR